VSSGFAASFMGRLYLRRLEECWELVEELQFLEEENLDLRAQLAQWESSRTTGGPPKPFTAEAWQNVAAPQVSTATDPDAPPLARSATSSSAKFSGNRPPPYAPAIDTTEIQT